MRASAYRDLSDQELVERTGALRQSLFNLRVRNTTKELENTAQISRERHELARALTVLEERKRKKPADAQPEPASTAPPGGAQ